MVFHAVKKSLSVEKGIAHDLGGCAQPLIVFESDILKLSWYRGDSTSATKFLFGTEEGRRDCEASEKSFECSGQSQILAGPLVWEGSVEHDLTEIIPEASVSAKGLVPSGPCDRKLQMTRRKPNV